MALRTGGAVDALSPLRPSLIARSSGRHVRTVTVRHAAVDEPVVRRLTGRERKLHMQDRYTGDIGDYVKLAILRALSPGTKLGVGWWRYPDEIHNADGRHVAYLRAPERWRHLDPDLFDHLAFVVASGDRRIVALQEAQILPEALYFSEVVPTAGRAAQRREDREAWLGRLTASLEPCDLVFLDPDNGLETKAFDLGAAKAGKSVAVAELLLLAKPGRSLLVYHHQTRMPGGHLVEIEHWRSRLRAAGFAKVDALRASAYSARAFFLLDAPEDMRQRAEALSQRWKGVVAWLPDVGKDPA